VYYFKNFSYYWHHCQWW